MPAPAALRYPTSKFKDWGDFKRNTNTPDDLLNYGGSTNLTIDHVFMARQQWTSHSATAAQTCWFSTRIFYKNWGAGSCHGQVSWNGSATRNSMAYNTMRTIEGSGSGRLQRRRRTIHGVEIYATHILGWLPRIRRVTSVWATGITC